MGNKHESFDHFQIIGKNFSVSRRKFPKELSKVNLTSPQECFEVFLRIYILFITSALWAKKKRTEFWRKAFGRLVKLLRLQRNILEETFFGEIQFSTSIYRLWARFFATFDKNNSASLSELQLTSTEERFDIVFWQSDFFSWFLDFTFRKLSNFWRKNFDKLLHIANWVSRGRIQGKILFEEE